MISLINDTINQEDLNELAEWLRTGPRLTKGNLTLEFEREFAKWLGTKYAVFVNSGSSANLIMLYALIAKGIIDPNNTAKNKVVVPALSWATDLAPVIQFNLEPILCDCNLDNLSVDLDQLELIFKQQRPAALMLVSILGLSPNMDKILELCKEYDVALLEDNCESLGTSYRGKLLGNFGVMSTTSFYFGHHMSTIEGGMIFTNDTGLYNILLSLRSHGWTRDWSPEDRANIEAENGITGINSLYTFYYPGFNVRATDLQAFLGLKQLKKLDEIIRKRKVNFEFYMAHLNDAHWKPTVIEGSYTSNFAFPIVSSKKDELIKALQANEIETRPLVSGSMTKQPMYLNRYIQKYPCYNAEYLHEHGLYLPNHPALSEADIIKVCGVVNSL